LVAAKSRAVKPLENGVSKEIWLGPLLGNNRSYLIERCADLVAQGKSDTFLYIAASHPLLELVTEQKDSIFTAALTINLSIHV